MARFRALVVLGALTLLGIEACNPASESSVDAGEERPSPSQCEPAAAVEPLNHGRPYVPPDPPCETLADLTVPVLEMPRNEVLEVYLPDHRIEELAIDYLVVPRPRVTGGTTTLSSSFDFDADPVDLGLGECPRAVGVAALFPTDATDDVISATVRLEESGGFSRRSRVFMARGGRSLSIRTGGITAASDVESPWYFLFEPARGAQRVTVRAIEALTDPLVIDGLPDTPGVIALFRSEAVSYDPEHGLVYGITGFSHAWRSFAEDWYGAVLLGPPAEALALQSRTRPGDSLNLADDGSVQLSAANPNLLVVLDPMTTGAVPAERKTVTILMPCSTSYRIILDGYADAILSDGSGTPIVPGVPLARTTVCAANANEASIEISGASLTGRAAFVVVTHEGAS